MSSKTVLLLALLAAVVLLISSEVAPGDLAETTSEINNAEVATQTTEAEIDDPSSGCRFGCCKFKSGKECGRCCAYAGEAVDIETHGDPHN